MRQSDFALAVSYLFVTVQLHSQHVAAMFVILLLLGPSMLPLSVGNPIHSLKLYSMGGVSNSDRKDKINSEEEREVKSLYVGVSCNIKL